MLVSGSIFAYEVLEVCTQTCRGMAGGIVLVKFLDEPISPEDMNKT